MVTTTGQMPLAKPNDKIAPKSHKCHRCDRVFSRREHLQRHERSHTKEKPFRCGRCPERFTRRDLLTRHFRLSSHSTEAADLPIRDSTHDNSESASSTLLEWPTTSLRAAAPLAVQEAQGSDATEATSNIVESSSHVAESPPHGVSFARTLFDDINAIDLSRTNEQSFSGEGPDYSFGMSLGPNNFDPFAPYLAQDFGMFMDSVPSLTHPFSLAHQPLPVIIPNLQTPSAYPSVHLHTTTVADRPQEQIHVVATTSFEGTPLSELTTTGSHLSRYGSRLPSLAPEDRLPLGRDHHGDSLRQHSSELFVSVECRQRILEELTTFPGAIDSDFTLPSRHALSRLITGYFHNFHDHYPIFHVPTFQLEKINVELLLVLAALGARYTMEPELGVELYRVARSVALQRISRHQMIRASVSQEPSAGSAQHSAHGNSNAMMDLDRGDAEIEVSSLVQMMQTLLILIAVSTWYKHEPAAADALSIRSALHSIVRECGKTQRQVLVSDEWRSWIQIEILKRTHLVIFCFLNIHTILFDLPPMMLVNELILDLPCSEKAWKASSVQTWRDAREESGTVRQTFGDAYASLFANNHQSVGVVRPKTEGFSALGGYALIHAVIQQIWLVRNGRMPVEGQDRSSLSNYEMNIFERALKRWTGFWESNKESSMDPLSPHGPLTFTSTALLRLAYIRLNMDLGPVRSLSSWDPYSVAHSLHRSAGARRSDQMTRAALHCAHALSIPVKLGINYVARTQLIHWSNQHALCSLECAVLLAKWLETVTSPLVADSIKPAEHKVLEFIAQLIAEDKYKTSYESILEQKSKLSALVVRLWAKLYQSKSVWQTVNLIGESLNVYADLLEKDHE